MNFTSLVCLIRFTGKYSIFMHFRSQFKKLIIKYVKINLDDKIIIKL